MYDSHFYDLYEEYLEESSVRQAHDWVFRIAMKNHAFENVIDLGCGLSQEFLVWHRPPAYLGLDLNVENTKNKSVQFIKANYRDYSYKDLSCRSFVSLFSSEITAPVEDNYGLYKRIFEEGKQIKSGLVSGFYYSDKKDSASILEAGDILSYQTLEDLEDVSNDIFSEKRVIMHVPSKMFGQNVYEVWKFFERRQ